MPVRMIPYSIPPRDVEWQLDLGRALLEEMKTRRSCRAFSDRRVERGVLELALEIAHSSPSGANRKPWRFVVVDDPDLKRRIRIAAEEEERVSYQRRFPEEWLEALEPIGTNWEKPFLEIAPYLVVVLRIDWELIDGKRVKNYYPVESTGLAAGFFLTACHVLGLATLTHTPSPMTFLRELLGRPVNEKPYLLIPVGFPAADCMVPDLDKKPRSAALQWNRPTSRRDDTP